MKANIKLLSCLLAAVAACSEAPPLASGSTSANVDAAPPRSVEKVQGGYAEDDFCAEHGVPESQCTKCNPALVAKFITAGDFCRDHGYPASVCPICRGTSPFPPPEMRVRLASVQTAKEAGIETTRAMRRPFGSALEVVGVLAFEPDARADLSLPEEAVIDRVHADVGDRVQKGDPLVTLRSASIGARRAELDAAATAHATARDRLERERRLFEKGLASRDDLQAAERDEARTRAALRAARAALSASGARPAAGGGWVLRAPLSGVVIERRAQPGHAAQAGETLIALADPSRIRAELEIPEAHAARVRPGQAVALDLPGGLVREARIMAVGAAVDPRTRTVRARAALDNADGALKGGGFVRARIAIAQEQAVVIPREAVQRVEGKTIVFVQERANVFRPVAVRLGEAVGGEVAVLSGLQGGETIVTTGAFLLATETRKDAIGAGCCEVE